MIRIERAKVGSTATTIEGLAVPCQAWLVTIGRRYIIVTTYRRPRPPVMPASRTGDVRHQP